MKRTTIRLPEDLLADVRHLATRTGRTLTAVIEDALRQALAQTRRRPRRPAPGIVTFRGDGLRPGVDLDDTASLLEIMDGRS
jgi:metal-responsive CopG/Arc/MetJ family transcriptional regulator